MVWWVVVLVEVVSLNNSLGKKNCRHELENIACQGFITISAI